MSNIYVGLFKDTILNFHKKALKAKSDIDTIYSRYVPEIADEEAKPIKSKLESDYLSAKSSITRNYNEVRELLAIANFPNVEDLTADRLLFHDSDIELSVADIKAFIERYADNYTMLRVISAYLQRVHPGMNEYTVPFKSIVMPYDRLMGYKKYAESALSLIDTIYQDPNVSELVLKAYGEESFGSELQRLVGTGKGLNDGNRYVPEGAKKAFDHINLGGGVDKDARFEFDFTPVKAHSTPPTNVTPTTGA